MSLFGVPEHVAIAEACDLEAQIARLRFRQARLLSRVYVDCAARGHGASSAREWVASRLDVAPETAGALVQVAQTLNRQPQVRNALEEGEVTFDRACELFKQPFMSADLAASRRWDVAGLRRFAARQRRLSRHCEREAYTHRYLAIQPNLDESQWDVHGRLAGADGRIVEKALHDRGDELRGLPGGSDFSRGQITADALVALAQDSVGDHGNGEATGGGAVSVFVDAAVAGEAKCEAGVVIEYGPRVGPAVLEELLCTGAVQIIGLEEGRPVVVSDAAKAVPVAVRRAVAARDGGCTADGCTSRYRLEPHHIAHRQHGGGHAADNLTTLCWFHHHVVVHGSGFSIHPDYVPGRLRFTRFSRNRAPPPDWQ